MSKEQENKEIVGRWFTEFWGNPWNPKVIEELAAPDMLLQYSLHEPRRGHADVLDFMTGFRRAFPDLAFGGAADLIARATMSSVVGSAAARTPDPPSTTFSQARCRRRPAARCASRARPCFALRTARSQRKSASTTA
jgi:hypothetical protein